MSSLPLGVRELRSCIEKQRTITKNLASIRPSALSDMMKGKIQRRYGVGAVSGAWGLGQNQGDKYRGNCVFVIAH